MTDAPRDRARPPPGTPSPTGVLLRSLLFLTGQYVSLLLFAPFAFLTFPLPLATRYRAVSQFARFNLWWLEKTCGLGFEVEGREHILSTPGIVMAKHQSAWETIGLQQIFPPAVFVMKRSLLLIPFLGWGLASAQMISINRGASKEALKQVARQGKDRLDNGMSVVIFPEGTRTPPGQSARFKGGGGLLARTSNALAVPVAHNAGEFWGRRIFDKKPGIITVSIGPPIDPMGKSAEEITRLAEQWVEAEMGRLREL